MVKYPLIQLTVRHGRNIAIWLTGFCFLLSLWAYQEFESSVFLIFCILMSICIGVATRLLAEIVEVVADALLPR